MITLPDVTGFAARYADEAAIRDACWHPGPGHVVIDVGAAIGSWTLPALAAGAAVIAVDPDHDELTRLRMVAELNGLAPRLATHGLALFDGGPYPGDMRAALAASPYADQAPGPGATFGTLDGLADRLGRLDWVKIDVEGAELGVLRGGLATLARLRPHVIIEDHTDVYPFVAAMDSARQCTELLAGLGYAVDHIPYGGPPARGYLSGTP